MTTDWITLKPSGREFDGWGTNLWPGDTHIPEILGNLSLNWARLWIDSKQSEQEREPDVVTYMTYTDEQIDDLWKQSDQIHHEFIKAAFDLCRKR